MGAKSRQEHPIIFSPIKNIEKGCFPLAKRLNSFMHIHIYMQLHEMMYYGKNDVFYIRRSQEET